MLFRQRAVYGTAAAALVAIVLLGLTLGTFATAESTGSGVLASDVDPALAAAVDRALPPRAAGSQVASLANGPSNVYPDAEQGAVYVLRAVCAGTGSVQMRLTDGKSSVQTRLGCSDGAREQRTLRLKAELGAVVGEFLPIGVASGVVGSQLLNADDDVDSN